MRRSRPVINQSLAGYSMHISESTSATVYNANRRYILCRWLRIFSYDDGPIIRDRRISRRRDWLKSHHVICIVIVGLLVPPMRAILQYFYLFRLSHAFRLAYILLWYFVVITVIDN